MLVNDFGLSSELAGWRLIEARAISDDGLVIVGYGINPAGQFEAWRAVLGPTNTGPTISGPLSATEECVGGGAYFTIEADVFDADGDDLNIEWHITYPDSITEIINDVVTFGEPPSPFTVQLNGGSHFFPVGESTVSVCASDGIANNECASPITVSVLDTVSPIIVSIMSEVIVGNDPGECFATVDLYSPPYAPEFSDECCPSLSATNNYDLDTFPIDVTLGTGVTTVNWTATDCFGNTPEVTQTVIVSDVEAPTVTAPADVIVGHDLGTCEATGVDLGMPIAEDNCGVASITNDAVEPYMLGDTEVTWYISDAAGNLTTVTQTVTVTNADPVADAGPDLYVECSANGGHEVTLDGSASWDPDNGDLLEYHWEVCDAAISGVVFDDPDSMTPTATFPLGSTTVCLTITDQCGASSTTDLLVVVEDTVAPAIQAAVVDTKVLWPPNHEMIPVALDILVSDDCTAPENLMLACTVESNESDDGTGDGAFTGDVNGQDGYTAPVEVALSYNATTGYWEGTMELRAERDGGGSGRKYSILCAAMDDSGNVSFATVCVTAPKNRSGRNQ